MDQYKLETQPTKAPKQADKVSVIVRLVLSIISLFKKSKDGKKPL